MEQQQVKTCKKQPIVTRHNVTKYGLGAVASAALLSSNAYALDVSTALGSSDAQSNIETGAVWVLGIAVVIFSARKVIGFFSR